MSYCPTCEEYMYGPGHVCLPVWNVWCKGDEDGLDPGNSQDMFAESAEDAAVRYADRNGQDEPMRDNVFVRKAGEEGAAEEFEINYYVQPVYEATAVKSKRILASARA